MGTKLRSTMVLLWDGGETLAVHEQINSPIYSEMWWKGSGMMINQILSYAKLLETHKIPVTAS